VARLRPDEAMTTPRQWSRGMTLVARKLVPADACIRRDLNGSLATGLPNALKSRRDRAAFSEGTEVDAKGDDNADVAAEINKQAEAPLLVLDGAWGVLLSRSGLSDADFRGEQFAEPSPRIGEQP